MKVKRNVVEDNYKDDDRRVLRLRSPPPPGDAQGHRSDGCRRETAGTHRQFDAGADDTPRHDELEDHDLGLSHDLPQARQRQGWAAAGCSASSAVSACRPGRLRARRRLLVEQRTASRDRPGPPAAGPPDGGGMGGESDVEVADGEIPEETAGPYPGDGSNGPNVLTESGIVRSDITSSFGSASRGRRGRAADGAAQGLRPDRRATSTALAGAAVYAVALRPRGQLLDVRRRRRRRELPARRAGGRRGRVGWSSPRSSPAATPVAGRTSTSRSTSRSTRPPAPPTSCAPRSSRFPEDVCEEVYATEGYEQSVTNLAQVSLDTDGIFSDGYSLQLAKVTGSVEDGYVATLNVPV